MISQGIFGDAIVKQPETLETQALHKFPTNASGLEFCGRQVGYAIDGMCKRIF